MIILPEVLYICVDGLKIKNIYLHVRQQKGDLEINSDVVLSEIKLLYN
jgi:hypothetical protein